MWPGGGGVLYLLSLKRVLNRRNIAVAALTPMFSLPFASVFGVSVQANVHKRGKSPVILLLLYTAIPWDALVRNLGY